jgi:predicted ribosomally synthesized peptide with SipW-like signal peptide
MNRKKKVLLTLLVVGVVLGLIALGVFSAFSATTSNDNNNFRAGSVAISDNHSASALYDVTGAKPGDSSTASCIKVTYTGSLGATVKLYRSAFTSGTGLDPYVNLALTKGTGNATDCSDFTPAGSGSSVYSGTLSALGTSYSSGSAVTLTNSSGSSTWSQNNAVTYKFVATLADDNNANGKVTGTHSFTWEAQNN